MKWNDLFKQMKKEIEEASVLNPFTYKPTSSQSMAWRAAEGGGQQGGKAEGPVGGKEKNGETLPKQKPFTKDPDVASKAKTKFASSKDAPRGTEEDEQSSPVKHKASVKNPDIASVAKTRFNK